MTLFLGKNQRGNHITAPQVQLLFSAIDDEVVKKIPCLTEGKVLVGDAVLVVSRHRRCLKLAA